MDILFRIWRYLSVVAIAAVLLVLVVVFSVRNEMIQNENYYYLPQDATWAVKIDVNELISKGATDLYYSEDKVFTDLRKILEKEGKQFDKNRDDQGILLTSDIYVFQLDIDDFSAEGTLYNLINKGVFLDYYKGTEDQYIIAANDDVGVVFIRPFNDKEAKKLQNKANQIVASKQNENGRIKFNNADGVFVSTWLDKTKLKPEAQQEVTFAVDGENIIVSGTTPIPGNFKASSARTLKPSGFHLSLKGHSDEVKQQIKLGLMMAQMPATIPPPEMLSINYRGLNFLDNGSVEFDGEILIRFESPIKLDTICALISKAIPMTLEGAKLNFGIFAMYSETVDDHTILLKGKENSKIDFESNHYAVHVVGNPNNLVEIKGSSIMKTLVSSLDWFGIMKDYLEDVDHINAQTIVNAENKFEAKVVIKPKKDKSLILKFLKVTLERFGI